MKAKKDKIRKEATSKEYPLNEHFIIFNSELITL